MSMRYNIEFDVPDDIEERDKPGLVIDGQHRLLGMKDWHEDCKVIVVALLNADDMEKAFQFLVINNKSDRVPSDHIRTLALDYQEEELGNRLRTARLTLHENLKYVGIINSDEESPFAGHITLETHENDEQQRFVHPAAIENSMTLIQQKKVRELESDDALCEFFYAIWSPIKEKWTDLWKKDSKLMNNVGIVCMTIHMTEALVSRYDWGELDIADRDIVCEHVKQLLRSQTPEFWHSNWSIRLSDTKAVRDLVVRSLTLISRNMRAGQSWYEDVECVSL
ncbi:hypothetical protein NKDENANG_01417 [Candidatus Entotheonellaceae bacterium PAL068K]